MELIYDQVSRTYVGERLRVSAGHFERTLRQLLQARWEPETALAHLLAEANWSVDECGVRPLAQARRCRTCGMVLGTGRRLYCTLACEATWYAAHTLPAA